MIAGTLILVPALAGLAAFVLRPNRPAPPCCCWPRPWRTRRWWRRAWIGTPRRCSGRLDGHRRPVAAVPEHHQRPVPGGGRLCRRLPRAAKAGSRRRPTSRRACPSSTFPRPRSPAACCLFLATMTLVAVSQHLGLLWVAVEATTLASAPLIYFHRHHARWRPPGNTC